MTALLHPALGNGEIDIEATAVRSASRRGASAALSRAVGRVVTARIRTVLVLDEAVRSLLVEGVHLPALIDQVTACVLVEHRVAQLRTAIDATAADNRSGPPDVDQLAAAWLQDLADDLSPHERQFAHFRYFDGLWIEAIAEALRLSERRCRELGRQVLEKLEARLLEDPPEGNWCHTGTEGDDVGTVAT